MRAPRRLRFSVVSRVLSLLGAALVLACTAQARTDLPITLDRNTNATLKVSCAFDLLPPSGYAPVDVTIRNDTGRRGTWHLSSGPRGRGYQTAQWESHFTLPVETGTERTFHLQVPLPSAGGMAQGVPLMVLGPGLDAPALTSLPTGGRGNKPATPFLGLSESLAAFAPVLIKEKTDASWTNLRLADLPEEWRALAGFDTLWFTVQDVRALAPGQRSALQDWLARGGRLFLYGSAEKPREFLEEGFGQVTMHAAAAPALGGAHSGLSEILALPPARQRWFESNYKFDWPAAKSLGEVKPNVPLLTALLIVLAGLIGPVNLYFFAGSQRRARLLWTTPLISLVASGLLIAFIFLQDGLGGWGSRYALVQVLPGQSKAAILQEQISRSSVLFSTQFHLAQPSFLTPIAPDDFGHGRSRRYSVEGQEYGGSWFSNRARQAQWLETVIPSRASVQQVGTGPGDAPILVSSIDAPLQVLYLRGDDGRLWQTRNLPPGEKRTLEAGPAELPPLVPEAGEHLRNTLAGSAARRSFFHAVTTAPGGLQETLRSIRWKSERTVYLGPVPPPTP